MLTKETTTIIKSTVPLLQQHGLEITTVFYKHLFQQNPELQHIFNHSNQQNSTQSRALADAVLAYAKNIDNLEALLPAVKLIAHKHASIGIKDHHYPLVGASLLEAIKNVLSLDDSHPAIKAWGEAYGVLADVFIENESALYSDRANKAGGWEDYRGFKIAKVVQETPEVKSFWLCSEDNLPIQSFMAGQYISVKLPQTQSGFDQIRQYSLSDWQEDSPSHYRLSIKAEDKGKVSHAMHDHQVGDNLLISAPFGDFTLRDVDENTSSKKHVFISGGVGVTPLFSMLKQAISYGLKADQLQFIECARSSEHQIFSKELNDLTAKNLVSLKTAFEFSEGGDLLGRLNHDILNEWIEDKSANIYFCGPVPFMSALKKILNDIGFEDSQLHYEVFGPNAAL